MDIITSTVRVGQKPTKEELERAKREYKEASKYQPFYDEDSPMSTPEALAEFAAKARELRQNKRRIKPAVTIRIMPDVLEKYKALGKGYTGIMSDVLSYAANNPHVLTQATQ
jgi:uncharacterized protein (DUF4415 family)